MNIDFFVGKGGVGKTSVSAAYAVHLATNSRGPVLLISTDPAHSLADIFDLEFGGERTRVTLGRKQLHLWQLDAKRQFEAFLAKHRDDLLNVLQQGTIFSREELAPLLDTTAPGMAEIAGLLAIAQLLESGEYDRLVVDTAPIGHTLRLFQMPEHFAKLLRLVEIAAGRDDVLARHFAGRRQSQQGFVGEWQRSVAAVRRALGGKATHIVLVTTPETFALQESVRTAQALAESDPPLRISSIVLNRALRGEQSCPRCKRQASCTQTARRFLKQHFPGIAVEFAEDAGGPLLGIGALEAFGRHVFEGKALRVALEPPKVPQVDLKPAPWPTLMTPLSLSIGKGGVGKTTVSAILSYHTRRERASQPMTICSTDPAPSLDDVFQQELGDQPQNVLGDPALRAMEVDATAEFRRWAQRVKGKVDEALTSESSGVHVDLSFQRAVFAGLLDMVPPGVDEVSATLRILDLVEGSELVMIDMAPTGHALELLSMPQRIMEWSRLLLKTLAPHRKLALAREAAVEIATLGQRVRSLAAMLQDSTRTRVYPVMLAEPLPDRETGRLLASLHTLRAPTAPLFVNRVLVGNVGACPRCKRRRAWQFATLALLRARPWDLFVVPEYGREIAGKSALAAATRKLWRIV